MSDCTTCAEYDGDKGYCPKYCEVIRRTVEELISREAAIEAIDDLPNCYNGYSDTYDKAFIIGVLEEQPTIDPVKWIPCKERLPDEDRNVFVSVHFIGLEINHKTGWNDHIKESWYVDVACQIDGEWFSASDEYKVAKNRHIVMAWMPLPEPWRGEEKE